jgi:hypothetical protein
MLIQLEREVIFGLKIDDFGNTSGTVIDQLSNRTIRYSFIDSPENGFKASQDKLLKALMNDPLVASFFLTRVRGCKIEWNKDGCIKWLKRRKKFLEMLMKVIHIVNRQPARAAELETVLIRNTVHGMRRCAGSAGWA